MSALLRAIGYVWTAPNTLVGLVLGALSFQRPRLGPGIVRFDRGSRRGFLWLFARGRWRAITFGHVVLSVQPLEGRLLRHELGHVRQYAILGPLYLPAYVLMHAFTGYAANPFETDASRREAPDTASGASLDRA